MSWTKEKPVQKGYFWYFPSGNERAKAGLEKGMSVIVMVEDGRLLFPGVLDRFDIKDFDGLWNGPVVVPPLTTFRCLQCGWKGNEDEMYMIPVDDETQDVIMNERTCPKCRSVGVEPL